MKKQSSLTSWNSQKLHFLTCAMLLSFFVLSNASASTIIVVKPEGDGNTLRARYGFFDVWNDYTYQTNASPTRAEHHYASGWGEIRRAHLQFSLESIAQLTSVESATLRLYVTHVGGSGSSISYLQDTVTANGNASQALAGNVFMTDLVGMPTNQWHDVDATDAINANLANSNQWAAFSLPSKSYSAFHFSSAEGGSEFAPHLVITPIPEPSSALLLMSFMAFNVALFRRRQQT